MLQRAQRVQDQCFDRITKGDKQNDDHPGDDSEGYVQPALVDDFRCLQVDCGDDVPFEFR